MPHLGTVAVLGAGLMGGPMAGRLTAAGMDVRIWNRTSARADEVAARHGAVSTPSPAEATEGADAVLTMLYDASAVEEAMVGPNGAIRSASADTLWLQSSTVGVVGEQRLREIAAHAGLLYADAPVLGTRAPAEKGELVFLASGEHEVQACAVPFMEPMSSRIMWLGPAGAGTRLKLVVNAWLLALIAAMAESIALAEGLGLDPRFLLDVLEGHPADAPFARIKAAAMLARDFPPSAHLSGGHKDARLVLDAAQGALPHPKILAAVLEQFAAADAAGHGDEDLAAVYWASRGAEERMT